MILFLFGADAFRSRQKLNEIIAKFKRTDKSGLNLETLDMSEKEAPDFFRVIGAIPFLAPTRLVIVKNLLADSEAKTQELISAALQQKKVPATTTVVFFEYQPIDKRLKAFRELKKLATSQEFTPLSEYELAGWIKAEVKKRGGKIEAGAADKLSAFTGNDLWRVSSELDKLLAYCRGRAIAVGDVAELVRANLDENIFHLVDAIGQNDSRQALKLLHENLALGKNEQYLLSMIAFQFKNLAQVVPFRGKNMSPDELKRELGMHPFVIRKTMDQARHFTMAKVEQIYDKLVKTDLAMKTGQIDPRTALDLLVVGLSGR